MPHASTLPSQARTPAPDVPALLAQAARGGAGSDHDKALAAQAWAEIPRLYASRVFAMARAHVRSCPLYTSPSPRDRTRTRKPSSAWTK